MEGDQAQLIDLRGVRDRFRKPSLSIVVAAGVVLLATAGCSGPEDDFRAASVPVATGTVHIGRHVPVAYVIRYRIDDRTLAGHNRSFFEDVTVDRPFAATVRKTSNGAEDPASVTTFGRRSVSDEGVVAYPPGVPDIDSRPDAVLGEAVRAGYARKRELRRVAGRLCRVFRISPERDGSLLPLDDPDAKISDMCVDEDGLVLEEASFSLGPHSELLERRIAVSVDVHPRIDHGAFELGEPTLAADRGGSVRELDPGSRLPGGPFWELGHPLARFVKRGRYAVIEPTGTAVIANRPDVLTYVSEVWTKGPDVVVIDQGAWRGANPFTSPPTGARTVRAGRLGRAELSYSLRSSEVIALTKGRFVRVRGTLPPSGLVALAKGLEPGPEGPLVPLEPGTG